MASSTINIASYTRPGIYITEIDQSIYQVPAQQTLVNLVAGFSKKGPINNPVLITTPQQFINIFGNIDRSLESKGSFFHRTVLNILANSPVWALNLLTIDETLDVIDWQSISLASDVSNSVIKEAPYDAFFNKAAFWTRDTDSFLTYANDNLSDPRLLMHLTNLSSKKVSVFIYKSSVTGFSDTLDIFYGGINNVPLYLDPKDQASDYLVSMAIVQGDWSDYATLSVDPRWGNYFNNNGLIKGQISNFLNDASVNVLSYYSTLSIIPYFQDTNGNDIFIETVVNNDTDTHGIFLAYDIDKVADFDYRNGLLDLIGSNLVADNVSIIDYISYNENIQETITYEATPLNTQGNAFGYNLQYETKYTGTPVFNTVIGASSTEVFLSGITNFNLNHVAITPNSTASVVEIPNVDIGKIRKDTLYLDENGDLGTVEGFEVSNQTQWANVPLQAISNGLLPIGIVGVGQQATSGSSGATLGVQFINAINNVKWGIGLTTTTVNVVVNTIHTTSFASTCGVGGHGHGTHACILNPIIHTTHSTSFISTTLPNDIALIYNGINQITFQFTNTKSTDPDTNYRKTLLNKIFADLQSNIIQGLSIILDQNGNKVTINNFVFNNSGTSDNSLTISVSPSININRNIDAQIYYQDNEQQFTPTSGYISLGLRTYPQASTTGSGYGVASIHSAIYEAFDNGIINTGDYFYPNLFAYKFSQVDFYKLAGNNYITLWYNSGDINPARLYVNRLIRIFGTSANNSTFTILNNGGEIGSQPGAFNTRLDLIVNESVTTETVTNGSVNISGASATDIRYLKMYFIGNAFYMDFTEDPTFIGVNGIDTTQYSLDDMRIFSDIGSFKETLEINSVLQSNMILVDASRYATVAIGDYLEAYVDPTTIQEGEVPKMLTRVINKIAYASDPTQAQIQTDAPINILTFGSDQQTYRYSVMEDYVNTYKSITLGGFKIRTASLPDGTETQQSNILNNIAVNTPLFNGLINKNLISWRYLVDCWGLGLTGNSKQQFVDLCGAKLTALGLLNMPSVKSFKNSTSPSFIDKTTKTLNTAFIASGGDPTSNPSFLYTFGQGAGQSNVAYFFPYVTITDNSRPTNVPPASFVCNAFMNKFTSRLASITPWTVVAGVSNGLITGIGNVEMDFTDNDISNLNQMNANPIVYKMNRGFCIETDNTAQVSPRSALSYIHVREVLIQIEQDLYNMLINYQWRFNTADVRAEIKANADAICQTYVQNNGLYAFLNVCDDTNNTPALIDAQIGVLQTYLEPIKSMQVIVNQITILKTGQISSGGFQNLTNN